MGQSSSVVVVVVTVLIKSLSLLVRQARAASCARLSRPLSRYHPPPSQLHTTTTAASCFPCDLCHSLPSQTPPLGLGCHHQSQEGAGHVMDADRGRLLSTFFALLARGAALAADYDDNHPDFKVRVLWVEAVTACSAPLRPPHRSLISQPLTSRAPVCLPALPLDGPRPPGPLRAPLAALLCRVGLRLVPAQRQEGGAGTPARRTQHRLAAARHLARRPAATGRWMMDEIVDDVQPACGG